MCTDKKYEEIKNELSDTLSEWKQIEFASFCQSQCNQVDVCDGAVSPSARRKRQTASVQDQLRFKGSVFNGSTQISMNVCANSDIKSGLNSVLSQMKKEKFVPEFCRIDVKKEVCDCASFNKLSAKFSRPAKTRLLRGRMAKVAHIAQADTFQDQQASMNQQQSYQYQQAYQHQQGYQPNYLNNAMGNALVRFMHW